MSHGIIRSTIFTLAGAFGLVVSNTTYNTAKEFQDMPPNDIAARMITDQDRKDHANLQLAITDHSGPVFDKVQKKCDEEAAELANAKKSIPLAALVLESHQGPITFNMEKCTDEGLNRKVLFAKKVPEVGQADESYKQWNISLAQTTAKVFGGFGLLCTLGGLAGIGFGVNSTRRKKATDPKLAVM